MRAAHRAPFRPRGSRVTFGHWGDGVYSPKWTSTTYTLLHLLWLGLPPRHPAALRGCERLWEWQARWRVPETCIAAILVRLTSSHGYGAAGLDRVAEDLLDQQLADGGWNCHTRTDKTKHGSFHTSIQVLEALDAYTSAGGGGRCNRVAVARPRVLPRAPAVPVAPHRSCGHPREYPFSRFSRVALRRASRTRALLPGRYTAGRAVG